MAKQAKRIQAWTGDREALMPFADAIKAVKTKRAPNPFAP